MTALSLRAAIFTLVEKELLKGVGFRVLLGESSHTLDVTSEGFFLRSNNLFEFFSANKSDYRVFSLGEDAAVIRDRSVWRPLDELYWTIAYVTHEVAGLDSFLRSDLVFLKRWPNFPRILHGTSDYQIAALLSRRKSSVDLCARILKIELQEVMRFCIASKAAGYLDQGDGASEVVEFGASGHDSVLKSLFRRLSKGVGRGV